MLLLLMLLLELLPGRAAREKEGKEARAQKEGGGDKSLLINSIF